MKQSYLSVQGIGQATIEIDRSVFLSEVFPIQEEKDYQKKQKALKEEHPDATHHVSAYLLGERQQHQRFFDDGEPSGTAGMPTLNVLKMEQLTYVGIITIRYFGGKKLGAGGLVRAYSNAAKAALDDSQIVTYHYMKKRKLSLSYQAYHQAAYLLDQAQILAEDVQFLQEVSFIITLDERDWAVLQAKVQAIIQQEVEVVIIEEGYYPHQPASW